MTDFSNETHDGWKSGLNKQTVAARLRELATKIEKNEVIVEDFEVAEAFFSEDLQMSTVHFTFNEKH